MSGSCYISYPKGFFFFCLWLRTDWGEVSGKICQCSCDTALFVTILRYQCEGLNRAMNYQLDKNIESPVRCLLHVF